MVLTDGATGFAKPATIEELRNLTVSINRENANISLGNKALDYSRRAVRIAPNDAETELALAISYGKILPYVGNKEKAESSRVIKAAAEKVIRLDPKNALAFRNRGVVYVYKGDNDRAIGDYNEAIRLDPKNAAAFRDRATAYA